MYIYFLTHEICRRFVRHSSITRDADGNADLNKCGYFVGTKAGWKHRQDQARAVRELLVDKRERNQELECVGDNKFVRKEEHKIEEYQEVFFRVWNAKGTDAEFLKKVVLSIDSKKEKPYKLWSQGRNNIRAQAGDLDIVFPETVEDYINDYLNEE